MTTSSTAPTSHRAEPGYESPLKSRPPRDLRSPSHSQEVLSRWTWGAGGALIVLLAWQLAASTGRFGDALPGVPATARALLELLGTSSFWKQTLMTVIIAAAGLAISAVIGVLAGFLIAGSRTVHAATFVIVEFLKPIPPIVVLPLAVLLWGPTSTMAVILVVLGCTLSITIHTVAGVRDADPVTLATAASYGLRPWETLWRVTLPMASPFIATALRVCAPATLIVTVVAGLLGGAPGLGRSLYQAQAAGQFPALYAIVVVLGILGLLAQNLSAVVERRILHWHPLYRKVTP